MNNEDKIKFFLTEKYNINAKVVKKIECGVLNSNYIIKSDGGEKYIFRIYHFKTREQVKFEVEILEYLKDKNFPCPRLRPSITGEFIKVFNDSPCIVYKYLEGENIKIVTPELIKQIGELEGKMHYLLKDFRPSIDKPTWEPEELKILVRDNREMMLNSKFERPEELMDFVQSELGKYSFPKELPVGVTHQDIKPENIIIKDDDVVGIIDFDNSYVGAFLHDITTTIIWSCFTGEKLNKELLNAFLSGYEKERKLTDLEKKYLMDGIKFRLVREVFIGPFVTIHYPELSRDRADYFIRLYNQIKKEGSP
ncbi:homoserine kinase [Candidatus Parcubacteria bacterium]|nr:homoserine kinase [Candidatus Parcubacteria bacterium]